MAWSGWLTYAGTEILNVSRTEAYVKNAGVGWFTPVYDNDSLAPGLGDGLTYLSPLTDDPPWADPNDPNSYDFYGVYPLAVNGLEDSTRESAVIQSSGDGGVAGRVRHATKTVVVNAVLMGMREAAVEYGFRWLKTALLGGACGPNATLGCSGADLCFLASEPQIDFEVYPAPEPVDLTILDGGTPGFSGPAIYDGGTPSAPGDTILEGGGVGEPALDLPVGITSVQSATAEACLDPLLRSLREVVFNSGPVVTSKRTTSDGQCIWTVTFTGVAGVPWEFGAEVPVIEGFLDPDVPVPWVGGEIPEGGFIDLDGFIHTDALCAEPVFAPLFDPLCPALVPPPTVPSIALGCFEPPVNWRRRQISFPREYVPLWGEVVPQFKVHARAADVRNLRIRFYADPQGDGSVLQDPCSWCGDLLVSYVPQDHTLVFDGVTETVWVDGPGGSRRRGDSLVFKTDGTPFDWPALSCGVGYVVTLDLPQYTDAPVFDLSLFPRIA